MLPVRVIASGEAMHPWPDTSGTLIARLKHPADRQAWHDFARRHEPLIFRFARCNGLLEADAEDIAQRVLRSIARCQPKHW
ncbi:MAG: hypothetical protein AAF989_09770 [Planctomycetota bacterium]